MRLADNLANFSQKDVHILYKKNKYCQVEKNELPYKFHQSFQLCKRHSFDEWYQTLKISKFTRILGLN